MLVPHHLDEVDAPGEVGLLEQRIDIGGLVDAPVADAEGSCEQREVGVDEVAVDVTPGVELELVLADQAERAVVDHHDVERNAVIHRGHQLHAAHLEAAVAEDGEARRGHGAARADGRGDRMAERRDARVGKVTMLRRGLQIGLRQNHVVVEDQRLGQPFDEAFEQVGDDREVGRDGRACVGRRRRGGKVAEADEQILEHGTDVAVDRQIGAVHLFELGGIVVHLDDALAGHQLRIPQIAGALVEGRAEHDDQVGMGDDVAEGAAVRGDAEAAERARVALGDQPLALERGGDADCVTLAELLQHGLRAGDEAAVAGDDHRVPRRADHAAHLLGRREAVADARRVGDEADGVEQVFLHRLLLDVVGQREQYRPGIG